MQYYFLSFFDMLISMKLPRSIRRFLLWGGGIVLFAFLLWGMAKLSATTQIPTGTLAVPVSAQDNAQGPASAPIVFVEYSDFQCPACAAFQPVLTQLIADADLSGKIRFIYRYFPLTTIHTRAQLSAQAAQAAALQGKFWQMHDALFEGQATWAGQSDTQARATFAQYAREVGLDMPRYAADLDRASVQELIRAQYDGGIRSGVNSTPSFFINGTRIAQPGSYAQLKQSLINALP